MHVFFPSAGFGLASHLGVLSGIPCVGVGKKLFHTDGLERSLEHREKVGEDIRVGTIPAGLCTTEWENRNVLLAKL